MVQSLRIAEVADRSGFASATLRYYEQVGVLPAPDRTTAGYRAYDESVLERLAFISRAKMLGCSLEEIRDLMPDWDGGRCAPVQDRLRGLTEAKLADTHTRIAHLSAFADDLQAVLRTLGSHTPDGPCDGSCGCVRDTATVSGPAPTGASDILCTLAPDQMPGRLEDWHAALAHVRRRTPVDGGVRLELDDATPLPDLARLVEAEQSCCRFFAFTITVDHRGMALEVRAPADGQPVVRALFGPY